MNYYLEHSAKGTSWTKKDHKWIRREKKNGKYVYYYATRAEMTKLHISQKMLENATEEAADYDANNHKGQYLVKYQDAMKKARNYSNSANKSFTEASKARSSQAMNSTIQKLYEKAGNTNNKEYAQSKINSGIDKTYADAYAKSGYSNQANARTSYAVADTYKNRAKEISETSASKNKKVSNLTTYVNKQENSLQITSAKDFVKKLLGK